MDHISTRVYINNEYEYYKNVVERNYAFAQKSQQTPCKKLRNNKNTMKYFKNMNQHLRKKGHLKQPGGASCNQRR